MTDAEPAQRPAARPTRSGHLTAPPRSREPVAHRVPSHRRFSAGARTSAMGSIEAPASRRQAGRARSISVVSAPRSGLVGKLPRGGPKGRSKNQCQGRSWIRVPGSSDRPRGAAPRTRRARPAGPVGWPGSSPDGAGREGRGAPGSQGRDRLPCGHPDRVRLRGRRQRLRPRADRGRGPCGGRGRASRRRRVRSRRSRAHPTRRSRRGCAWAATPSTRARAASPTRRPGRDRDRRRGVLR